MVEEKNNSTEDSAEDPLDLSEIEDLFDDNFSGDEKIEEGENISAPDSENQVQDDIDALLEGISEDNGEEWEEGDIDAEGESAAVEEEEGGSEEDEATVEDLDQDSIDALFSESGISGEEAEGEDIPAETEEDRDIDQSSIDALVSGGDEGEGREEKDTPAPEPVVEEEGGELDQNSIDALFGGEEKEESAVSGPDEEDEEEEDEKDEEGEYLDELFAGLEEGEEEKAFVGNDFVFAEEVDNEAEEGEIVEMRDNDQEQAGPDEKSAAMAAAGQDEAEGQAPEKNKGKTTNHVSLLKNRKVMAGIGGFLTLIIAICLYFLLKNGEGVKERSDRVTEPARLNESGDQKNGKKEIVNFIPVARNANYRINEDGDRLGIILEAVDQDDDNLTFTVTREPDFGRLSGTPPDLTYLPDDDFPGRDSFKFKAGDGKAISKEAEVVISGPDLAELAALRKKEEAEKEADEGKRSKEEEDKSPQITKLVGIQPPIKASDFTFTTKSTESVVIDLAGHWEKMNQGAYDRTVFSEMNTTGLRGSIKQIDKGVYRYKPDPFFSGIETMDYRFKKNGISSPTASITIKVPPGDPPPEIRLAEMKLREYKVGETVVIDAGLSRDDKRKSLKFDWDQVEGTPVRIRKENQEGSKISFIMPSAFSNQPDPGPRLKLTVVDDNGQRDTRFIKIRSVSLRGSALWRGIDFRSAGNPLKEGKDSGRPYGN
ncbi:MAG: Ig-like domain-containing protein [Desulfurivibrionaceae bacterium]